MKAERNSFLELFRFIFSLFILLYHNFFFVTIPVFGEANFALDFFFVLSGLFMIQTLRKYDELPFLKGLKTLLKDRLKYIWVAVAIGVVFAIVSWFLEPDFLFKPRLMWFVLFLLVLYAIYFAIKRLVKTEKRFIVVVCIIGVVAAILRFSPLIVTNNDTFNSITSTLYEVDELRGVICVPIGILVGLIPDFNNESNVNKNNVLFMMLLFSIILICTAIFTSNLGTTTKAVSEIFIDLIAFPLLLYVSRYYKFNNKVINVLGSLSPFIYIYQQIPYTICYFGIENQWLKFLMVFVPVLIHLYFIVRNQKRRDKRA